MSEDLSTEEIADIRKTFNALDKNSDEKISKEELIKGIHLLKVNPIDVEVEDIVEALNLDGDGLITWDEYLKSMSTQIKKRSYEEQLFTQAFKKFDKDDSGYIDKEELKIMLKPKGSTWTDKDKAYLDELFAEADEDEDGRVNYAEFVKCFCDM